MCRIDERTSRFILLPDILGFDLAGYLANRAPEELLQEEYVPTLRFAEKPATDSALLVNSRAPHRLVAEAVVARDF